MSMSDYLTEDVINSAEHRLDADTVAYVIGYLDEHRLLSREKVLQHFREARPPTPNAFAEWMAPFVEGEMQDD